MLIFAHRGASAIEPENTLLAIQAAIDIQVDGIEIDIFELENKLVVIHDRWLERTTSGSGLIFQYSFEKLRQLDAGKGEKIPTLDEVLAIMPKGCVLNIELKGINDIALLFKTIEQAKASYHLDDSQILLSSFNHHQLLAIAHQHPELPIGVLTASLPLGYAKFTKPFNAYSVHISINSVSKNFVLDAHQRGLKAFVYTVDEREDIVMLHKLGVDGIFANNPKQAREYLQQIKPK